MCGKRRTVGGKFKGARSTKVFVGRAHFVQFDILILTHFVQFDKVKIPNFMQFFEKKCIFAVKSLMTVVDAKRACP